MVSEFIRQNRSSLLLLLIMLILPITVSSVSVLFLSEYEEEIRLFGSFEWGLFYMITSFTMAFALTPTTFVSIVTGCFVGWNGLYGLIPSYLIASLIGFVLAYFIDKGKFFNQLQQNQRIGMITKNLKEDEFWVIFFCRISPVLPFSMMNVFLSYMKVNVRNYIGGSLLGMLPRTLLSVWIGTQANDIIQLLRGKSEPDGSKLLIIGLLVLSIVGLYYLFMKAIRKYSSNAN